MALLFADPFDALFQLQQTLDAFRASEWLSSGPSAGGSYPPLTSFARATTL